MVTASLLVAVFVMCILVIVIKGLPAIVMLAVLLVTNVAIFVVCIIVIVLK